MKAAYDRIRGDQGDTAVIAGNIGLSKEVLDVAKRNLFLDVHEVQTAAERTEIGRFTPRMDLAKLWELASSPTIDATDRERFYKLVAHEYIDSVIHSTVVDGVRAEWVDQPVTC